MQPAPELWFGGEQASKHNNPAGMCMHEHPEVLRRRQVENSSITKTLPSSGTAYWSVRSRRAKCGTRTFRSTDLIKGRDFCRARDDGFEIDDKHCLAVVASIATFHHPKR